MVDLSERPPAERDAAAARLATEQRARPFDLAAGPLLRGQVARLDHDHHALILTTHHIVVDGWAGELLVRELAAAYAAEVTGHASGAGAAADPVRRLRPVAARVAVGGDAGQRARVLAASSRGRARRPRPAARSPARGRADLHGAPRRASRRRRRAGCAPRPQPARGCHALHDRPGRLQGAARSPQRPGRRVRRRPRGRPPPRRDGAAHRRLHQHARAAHAARSAPDLPRAAATRARDGAGRLRARRAAVREAGRGAAA